MKLNRKQIMLVSFMLFSLFFGAGNLIFPPFLGQNAGSNTMPAIAFFLITAVILPVLGVIVVARFDGLEKLGNKVGKRFSLVFTILIYLSIGPGLGIPRAASLPFEMALAPYLPEEAPLGLFLLIFSAVFFTIALWLAMTPNKLVERIGKFLTPTLLTLIVFLFINYLLRGQKVIAQPQPEYASNPYVKGFLEGYLTMDTIAALNFGIVIANAIRSFKVTDKKSIMKYTALSGLFAGMILASVYLMLSTMGMGSSGVFTIQENGAWTLRCIVHQVFGDFGAILLAAIFTLACLTTCVGLITSCSQYFSTLSRHLTYKRCVYLISGFSFLICNQGLNMILSISVPVLDAIYPVSIVLIVLGLCEQWISDNKWIYPSTILVTGIISVVYALENTHILLGSLNTVFHLLPFYSLGLGWVSAALFVSISTIIMSKTIKKA